MISLFFFSDRLCAGNSSFYRGIFDSVYHSCDHTIARFQEPDSRQCGLLFEPKGRNATSRAKLSRVSRASTVSDVGSSARALIVRFSATAHQHGPLDLGEVISLRLFFKCANKHIRSCYQSRNSK